MLFLSLGYGADLDRSRLVITYRSRGWKRIVQTRRLEESVMILNKHEIPNLKSNEEGTFIEYSVLRQIGALFFEQMRKTQKVGLYRQKFGYSAIFLNLHLFFSETQFTAVIKSKLRMVLVDIF